MIENNTAIQNDVVETATETKPYTFRRLGAEDVSPMCKVIGKIGLNEFTKCFESDSVMNLIDKMKTKGDVNMTDIAGFQVILEIANVIISHIPDCEKDLFILLSNVSGLTVKEIRSFDLATFAEMVIDFVKKEEFKDFLKVVSKLFN